MRFVPRLVLAVGLPLVLGLAIGACAGIRPGPPRVDPAVADRAYAAGLLAEATRVREATALAWRAPRLAYPIPVPSDLGLFLLDGATVEEDEEEVYYALRYRRPDGACFTVTGSDGRHPVDEWLEGTAHESIFVEVPALYAVVALHQVQAAANTGGELVAGDLISDPLDADGLEVTFFSRLEEATRCRPVSRAEAETLLAGLRPLNPADDLEGAYRPLSLTLVQDHREGDDSEGLALYAFAPPAGEGTATVQTVRRTERRAVILVTSRATGAPVRDRQVRAVFVYGDVRAWRLVSAGERFRCQPGRGHQDWSPQPCE